MWNDLKGHNHDNFMPHKSEQMDHSQSLIAISKISLKEDKHYLMTKVEND